MGSWPASWRAWLRRDDLVTRLRRLRRGWPLLARLACATALAWLIATHVFGHNQAFFAPVAAVITITAGGGLRRRTLIELIAGVSLGVLVGETLIHFTGRGTWQIALVVGLTTAAAMLIGLKGIALTQSATSSVLLTAVLPVAGSGNPAVTRFLDALVGGLCGLLMVIVIPRDAVGDIDRETQVFLRRLSGLLTTVARALRGGDAALAEKALNGARAMQPSVEQLMATSESVGEIVRMSPVRWRQRGHVQLYASAVLDLDNALRDTRVLARRASSMLRFGEAAPEDQAAAIELLAGVVGAFAEDLAEQDDFEEVRSRLVEVSRLAMPAPDAVTLNTAAIAAQVRSLAADLLFATGYTRDEVDRRLSLD